MHIRVGTSGWSYPEWKGSFYPARFPSNRMLAYYADRFSTVEVNNSFYRIPSERILAGWSEQVPSHFQFVVKASRRITHFNRLNDEDSSLGYFCRAVNPLGQRLGPTLFQLPPTFTRDADRLQNFLRRLPRHWRAAVEFRHASWFEPEIYQLLRARNVPMVAVDEDAEGISAPLVTTADWGYLRLRRRQYSAGELRAWAARIGEQPWTGAYVFLKHEEGSPTGPAAAQQLQQILSEAGLGDEDHDSSPSPSLL